MTMRPPTLDRTEPGYMPRTAERALIRHLAIATLDWPPESRLNLVADVIAALDEAREDGIDASLAAQGKPALGSGLDATIEAPAAAALFDDVGGGP
ncbi:MAG: hypothetical protein KDJ37_08715 [Hyphomicrobiaceae bacterium]|nr:hypothetical protein [Hyphomicrobiaceae bacterium]